jgi:hypothetical protein
MQGIANTGITTHLIKFKKSKKVITHRTLYSTLSSSTYHVESMSSIIGYTTRQSHLGQLPSRGLRRHWAHHNASIDAGPGECYASIAHIDRVLLVLEECTLHAARGFVENTNIGNTWGIHVILIGSIERGQSIWICHLNN